jgi:hypothetical protein
MNHAKMQPITVKVSKWIIFVPDMEKPCKLKLKKTPAKMEIKRNKIP